jgi:hypothetical protein
LLPTKFDPGPKVPPDAKPLIPLKPPSIPTALVELGIAAAAMVDGVGVPGAGIIGTLTLDGVGALEPVVLVVTLDGAEALEPAAVLVTEVDGVVVLEPVSVVVVTLVGIVALEPAAVAAVILFPAIASE